MDILQQIKELETNLIDARDLLKTCSGEIERLKNQKNADQQALLDQENELKELRKKLFTFNQNKEAIQQALNDKVIELENSNLSKEEIKDKVIELFKNSLDRLSICSQSLNKIWGDYANSRDKVIEIMKEKDKHAYEAINAINDTKKNQWRVIWGLLILVVALSLSLSLSLSTITSKKRQRNSKIVKSSYK